MARPRSFSIDAATERAMQVFWQHGYDEAGLAELLDAMEIVRGSFYKAFGSKQALFLRVLERYDAEVVDRGVALLTDATMDGRERIAVFFSSALDAVRAGDRRGCLLCNTASGPVLEDEDVRDAVEAQMTRLADAFADALEADFPDEVAAGRKPAASSCTMSACACLGRGGFDAEAMLDGVRGLLGADQPWLADTADAVQ